MITSIIRKTVKYRLLITVYLSGAADWNWNPIQECFVPASIYLRWNARLLLTLGSIFPFLMTTFLLSKVPNEEYMESTENFVIFIFGWTEMVLITCILMGGLQLIRYWREVMHLMNEMSRYSDHVEGKLPIILKIFHDIHAQREYLFLDLMKRRNTQFDREEKKHLDKADILIAITGELCTFVPVAFAACICVRMEPTHAMLQEWLEVDISFRPKFIPFILFISWIVSNAASVVFSAINFVYQYLLLSRSVVFGLTPQSTSKMVQPGTSKYKVIIRYDLNSTYFGVLDEMTAVQIYRTQQIFNSITNDICGNVLISFHHVGCMLAFLGGALGLLQATDVILDGGPLVVAVLVLAVIVPLVLEYEESKDISELCQKSEEFVRRCVNLTDPRSMLYKFAKSCPKLKVHTGYPFFNVGKDTFTQFWGQGLDLLIGRGVKMLAVLNGMMNGILSAIYVITLILILIDQQPNTSYPTTLGVFFLAMFPTGLVLFLLDFVLSTVLFTGAKKRSPKICKIWMIITGFIIGLCFVRFLVNRLVVGYVNLLDIWVFFWIPFKIFEILVVYALFREVTDGIQEEGNGQVYSMTDTRPLAPTTKPQTNYTQTPQ
ncbi:unnamed protein product [Orchesella dallaii]|uniref:Uncharacterized protein n=1 Tax=Orchesella dallaii TaxID=48710 RepID=A0ABP1Q5V7_9HEXA